MPNDTPEMEIAMPYLLPDVEIVRRLGSSVERGLSDAEVAARTVRLGPNEISSSRHSRWKILLRQFNDPQMFVLLGASALSLSVSQLGQHRGFPAEACLIFSIALINAALGFFQEDRAEQALAALRQMVPARARVIRNGISSTVETRCLVPGDIVLLTEGCFVPADCRILQTSSLQVTEAMLTGESGTVAKQPETLAKPMTIADQSNMGFAGTTVISGNGVAIVIATGGATEMGKIARLMASTPELPTRLQQRLRVLSKRLTVAVAIIALVSAGSFLWLLQSRTLESVTEVLLFGISLGVAAAPEALGTLITLVLAIGVRRLAREGAIVRRLSAVDTLGEITVILSDKTGTLTLNRMSVEAMYPAEIPTGQMDSAVIQPPDLLLKASLLASAAEVREQDGRWTLHGDPLEQALWQHALDRKVDPDLLHEEFRTRLEVPFTPERKRMSVLSQQRNGTLLLFTKGAPEEILSRCTMGSGALSAPGIHWTEMQNIRSEVNRLAAQGLKVIAVAGRTVLPDEIPVQSTSGSELEHDLTWLGLITFLDPLRPHARDSIREAWLAGIRTILVSGDHAGTAQAIARRLGIAEASDVLSGSEIDAMDDAELTRRLLHCSVLARVHPAQKLRVAKVLQREGDVVAMTGDGVNDAPVLQQADVGIAMGSGTDLAKEAADVILTDDNFATIVRAVKQGRVLAANVTKAVTYLFSSNLCEVVSLFLVALYSIFRGSPSTGNLALPMTTPQILWVNLVTDIVPALAIALSPPRDNVMSGWRHRGLDTLFSARGIRSVLFHSGVMTAATLGVYFSTSAGPVQFRQTMTLTTLILAQAFYAITLHSEEQSVVRYLSDLRWLSTALFAMVCLHLSLLAFAPLRGVFGLTKLSVADWAVCLSASALVLVFSEILKAAKRRHLHAPPTEAAGAQDGGSLRTGTGKDASHAVSLAQPF